MVTEKAIEITEMTCTPNWHVHIWHIWESWFFGAYLGLQVEFSGGLHPELAHVDAHVDGKKNNSVPKHVGHRNHPVPELPKHLPNKSLVWWVFAISGYLWYDGTWYDDTFNLYFVICLCFESIAGSHSNLARRTSQTGSPMISGCKNSTTLAGSWSFRAV